MGMSEKNKLVNWKLFSILSGVCAIASVMVIPYQAALSPEIASIGAILYLTALLQGIVIFSFASFLGLLLARKAGISLPVLECEDKWGAFIKILTPSILLGVLSGALIVFADIVFQSMNLLPDALSQEEIFAPAWAALLASFYGGIAEEVLMRLFLMSLFVWLIAMIARVKERPPAGWVFWAAIILASVLFGIGHLPFTSTLVDITAAVVARAVLLNGIGGVVFGWLYWKKGLAAAMVAHFSADIVLHIITPAVAGALM